MTDPHDLDELASAHLDGATTPEEAARVEADPELRARVDALREVRDQLRAAATADPPVDAGRRDAAIAAAIAQASDPLLADVTPIAEARRRRGKAARWVAAAAVLVLGAARVVPELFDSDGTGDDVAATALDDGDDSAIANQADDASEEAERSGDDSAYSAEAGAPAAGDTSGDSLDSGASTTTRRTAGRLQLQAGSDLGTFPDLAALTARVRDALVDSPAIGSAPLPSDEVAACLAAADAKAIAAGSELELSSVAVVADLPVVVTVTLAADATRTMDVVDPAAACAPVHSAVL